MIELSFGNGCQFYAFGCVQTAQLQSAIRCSAVCLYQLHICRGQVAVLEETHTRLTVQAESQEGESSTKMKELLDVRGLYIMHVASWTQILQHGRGI